MAFIGYDKLRSLGVLNASENPNPMQQGVYTSASPGSVPRNGTGRGVSVSDVLFANFQINLKKDLATSSGRVRITNIGADGDTFTVTLDAPYVYTRDSDDAVLDVLSGLASLINAGADYSAYVDTNVPELVIFYEGAGAASFAESTSGTADMELAVDATSCDIEIYGLLKNQSTINQLRTWSSIPNTSFTSVGTNISDRVNCAGYDELFVVVTNIAGGEVEVIIAPCELEDSDG